MAKGFAAGLIQGGVVCGAGLVALSLALPQPPRPDAGPGQGGATQIATAPKTTPPGNAASPLAAAPDETAPAAPQGPAAELLSVPAGSEFARGSDMQPQMPQPLAETPRIAAAPAVARPTDEAAPEAAEAERLRPETRGDAPAAPVIALPVPDPIDLPAPAEEAPIPVPPPGKVVVPGLDRAPEQLITAPDNPAASLRAGAQPDAEAVTPPEAAAVEADAQPEPDAIGTDTTGTDTPEAAAAEMPAAETPNIAPQTADMPAAETHGADADGPDPSFVTTPADAASVEEAGATYADDADKVMPVQAPAPSVPQTTPSDAPPRGAPDLSLPPDFGALHLND